MNDVPTPAATATRIINKAGAFASRIGAWALRRARERSTWAGLAMVAAAAGKSVLADHLNSAADILPMVLGAGGAALAAASTTARVPAG